MAEVTLSIRVNLRPWVLALARPVAIVASLGPARWRAMLLRWYGIAVARWGWYGEPVSVAGEAASPGAAPAMVQRAMGRAGQKSGFRLGGPGAGGSHDRPQN